MHPLCEISAKLKECLCYIPADCEWFNLLGTYVGRLRSHFDNINICFTKRTHFGIYLMIWKLLRILGWILSTNRDYNTTITIEELRGSWHTRHIGRVAHFGRDLLLQHVFTSSRHDSEKDSETTSNNCWRPKDEWWWQTLVSVVFLSQIEFAMSVIILLFHRPTMSVRMNRRST